MLHRFPPFSPIILALVLWGLVARRTTRDFTLPRALRIAGDEGAPLCPRDWVGRG